MDCVGGSPLLRYRRLLASGGRWVAVAPDLWIYALAPFSRAIPPLLGLPELGFVVVRPRREDLEEIGRLVARGLLRIPVSASYVLDRIAAAHQDVASGHGRGKRVLLVSREAGREPPGGGESAARTTASPVRGR